MQKCVKQKPYDTRASRLVPQLVLVTPNEALLACSDGYACFARGMIV